MKEPGKAPFYPFEIESPDAPFKLSLLVYFRPVF